MCCFEILCEIRIMGSTMDWCLQSVMSMKFQEVYSSECGSWPIMSKMAHCQRTGDYNLIPHGACRGDVFAPQQ